MRKCIRCDKEMTENLDIKLVKAGYGIRVTEYGIFKPTIGEVRCAVCPECGYTELYVPDTTKIRKLNNK